MAYINRGQAAGTWAESHYTYQIRTFWIGLLYSCISILLMFVADRISADRRGVHLVRRPLRQGPAMVIRRAARAKSKELDDLN